MARREEPDPVKAFVALLAADGEAARRAVGLLEARWGAVDLRSARFPFTHTDYYEAEMGPALQRELISFQALLDPDKIVELKQVAVQIEAELSTEARRTVNLDPGYLDYTKVVLASYKPGGQKVYLRDGVYADIVLLYAKGQLVPFAWTFPDFQAGTYHDALRAIRRRYREQRRG
jgi:hypothetical protein